jgi:hypothetical protein
VKRWAPDYTGGSIVNLAASLLQAFGAVGSHPPCRPDLLPEAALQAPAGVVLLVCDALGADQLAPFIERGAVPHIAELVRRAPAGMQRLTSVFPSTTSVALTSLYCCSTPAEHGVLGMYQYFAELGALANMLTYRTVEASPRPLPPGLLSRRATLYETLAGLGVPSWVVNAAEYEGSPFSDMLHRGAAYLGFRTQSEIPYLLEEAIACAGGRRGFYSLYWPGVDMVAHTHGPLSAAYGGELEHVDLMVGKIAACCARHGCALVLTADHGQTALRPEQAAHLDGAVWDRLLRHPPAGGKRAMYWSVADAAAVRRHPLVNSGAVQLVEVGEAVDLGWLGGGDGGRLGDFIALPGDGVQLLYDYGSGVQEYRGAHAGLSADEMLVPLVAVPGD